MSYKTGGVIPGKSGSRLPGEGAQACSVEAASEGTTSNQPNVTADTPPGGYGSTGSASSSKPSKK
jgi:hypothetical protein